MISANVFKIAQTHADALKDSIGKSIVASGRSNLSNLVGLSYIGSLPDTAKVELADVLAAATEDSIDGPSQHTAALGAEIDALIPLVSSHISFVQNEVCPKVFAFDEAFRKQVDRLNAETPYGLFDVVQVNSPAPLENSDFMALIERFGSTEAHIPRVLGTLPAQSVEQLIEVMRVSSNAVNKDIALWVSEMGENWLLDVWHHYFATYNTSASGAIGLPRGGFAGLGTLPVFERLNVNLALFLLSRGLLDSPLEDGNMSLDAWRESMDEISRYAGGQVLFARTSLKNINTQQTLILGTFDNGKRIMVYSPVYAKYLEEGGTMEDVLGAAISNRAQSYSLANLQQEGEGFRQIWKNFQAMGQSTLNARAATILRSEAKALFGESLRMFSDDETSLLNMVGKSAQTMAAEAEDYIDSLALKDLYRVRELALYLIAGIRFSHTPAKQFLTDMHEAEEAGCDSPAEAALIAAMNYICDYQASQLGLVSA